MFIRPHPLRPLGFSRSGKRSADPAPYLLAAAQQSDGAGLGAVVQRYFFEQIDSLAAVTATIIAPGTCRDEQQVFGAFAAALAGASDGQRSGALATAPEAAPASSCERPADLPKLRQDASGRWQISLASPKGTTVALSWRDEARLSREGRAQREMATGQVVEAVAAKLTDLAKINQLGRLAFVDPLTGLGNSRQLKRCVSDQINRANRFGGGFALLFVDLDKFKAINDTHGHAEGDRVLTRIAALLRTVVRSVDQVFRLAGDEFVVVLAGAGARTSEAVVDRLKQALRGNKSNPTCSVGIACYPGDGQTYNELLKVADQGMYLSKVHHAKARGRPGDRDQDRHRG